MTMLPPNSALEAAQEAAAVLSSPALDIADPSPCAQAIGPNLELSNIPRISLQGFPVDCTLQEVVEALSEVTAEEDEVLATLCHMLDSGRIRLRTALRDPLPGELLGN